MISPDYTRIDWIQIRLDLAIDNEPFVTKTTMEAIVKCISYTIVTMETIDIMLVNLDTDYH